ncbi:MAG TPA: hemerythrin domain-containing protein [Polyangiaceae bacterium]|nr:hemerythrin domain-containing protein [Polyangiaceae bacterium]
MHPHHGGLPNLFGRATVAFPGHDALEPLIRNLRRLLSTPDAQGREQWVAALSPFSECLLAHFEAEERGGYFTTLAEDRPDLEQLIEALRIEHRQMREIVRLVSDFVQVGEDALVARSLTRLLDMLDAHERRESDLMRDFLAVEH